MLKVERSWHAASGPTMSRNIRHSPWNSNFLRATLWNKLSEGRGKCAEKSEEEANTRWRKTSDKATMCECLITFQKVHITRRSRIQLSEHRFRQVQIDPICSCELSRQVRIRLYIYARCRGYVFRWNVAIDIHNVRLMKDFVARNSSAIIWFNAMP